MARSQIPSNLSLAQLEQLINRRRRELDILGKRRQKLTRQLERIDEQIRELGGGIALKGIGAITLTAGGRVRNEQSLVGSIESVLSAAGTPLPVGEIVKRVLSGGYRSNSANFRGIVNQTLIKERKRFANVGRGVYGLNHK